MADVLFLSLLVGFFSLAALLVKGCERIIGPDVLTAPDAAPARASVTTAPDDEAVAA